MVKSILISIISIFLLVSCNTTAQFQKSFDNNQGVLVVPLNYLKGNTPDNISQLIDHRLSLVMINKGSNQKITRTVTMSLNNKYIVMNSIPPGAYEIVQSYYLKGAKKEIIEEESIDFMVKAGEFSVLPNALYYKAYADNTGKYWLTKKFIKIPFSERNALKKSLESMMPATVSSSSATDDSSDTTASE